MDWKSQPYTRNYRQLRKEKKVGKVAFPGEEHTNWPSVQCQIVIAANTHKSNIMKTE